MIMKLQIQGWSFASSYIVYPGDWAADFKHICKFAVQYNGVFSSHVEKMLSVPLKIHISPNLC